MEQPQGRPSWLQRTFALDGSPSSLPKCPGCGSNIAAGAKFCSACGSPLDVPATTPAAEASEQMAEKGVLKLFAGIFVAGALVIAIAIGLSQQPSANPASSVDEAGRAAAEGLDAQGRELSAAVDAATAGSTSGRPDAISAMVEAKANLRANLKDPDSAQFRNLFVSKLDSGAFALCGEVNSKNGYGGYTGFSRFIASANASAPTLVEGDATGLGEQIDNRLFPQAYAKFCGNVVERF